MFRPYNQQQLSEPSKRILLANSLTFTIGDTLAVVYSGNVITATNAFATTAGVNVQIFGVIAGFEDVSGNVLPLGNSSTNANQKTIASGTGANIYAVCWDPNEDIIFSADLDAVSGTTAGSNQPYVYFNMSDAANSQVDEDSVTRTLGTSNQVYSFGVDPNNTSAILCKIICTDTSNVLAS